MRLYTMQSRRIMLKISGEQLGSDEYNFDVTEAGRICDVIEAIALNGLSLACVMGGGNIVRGKKLAENGFGNKVVADHMGMLATVQNGLFLQEILSERERVKSMLFSNVESQSLVERFSYKRATKALDIGKIVLIAGGTGKPGVTTDTATVMAAYELHCDTVVKTTKVSGIYTEDPVKNPEAIRYQELTFDEAIANPKITVMDKAAMGFAAENGLSVAVCQPFPGQTLEVLRGNTSNYGTIVRN